MECKSKQKSNFNANLEVNEQNIELNAFVESFISQSVVGMLKPLRGVGDIETIVLKISNKAKSS